MIQKEQKNISAIILSAGKSERMGVPKFSLRFNTETTFLEKLIDEYHSFGCNEIIVVLNETSAVLYHQLKLSVPSNVRVVINHHPEWERFYSLKLAALALNEVKPVFVSNIDNPFLNQETLDILFKEVDNFDYISPSFNGKGGHPFLLSTKVLNELKTEKQDQIHLKEFLGKYSKKLEEVNDEKILLNINTMEDYSRFFN
ncbi:MAG TPA: NTP transferase domain-containing protein [Tenuifilaceae bacterium]|nr:NTP transferase domain-containing protein [Tenuifilaceae bacterium]